MTISDNGIDFIKQREGCKLTAYQDQGGTWTIGYGTTDGVEEGMTITQDVADQDLISFLDKLSTNINAMIHVSVTQNQFDAVCSFTYNEGLGSLQRSYLLKYINLQEFQKAANDLLNWVRVGTEINQGLVNRRNDERALFLS